MYMAASVSALAQLPVTQQDKDTLTCMVVAKLAQDGDRCTKLTITITNNVAVYLVDCDCDGDVKTYRFDSDYRYLWVTQKVRILRGDAAFLWSLGLNSLAIGGQTGYFYADFHGTWDAESITNLKPIGAVREVGIEKKNAALGINFSLVMPFHRWKIFAGVDLNSRKVRDVAGAEETEDEVPNIYRFYVAYSASINYYFKTWMIGVGSGFRNTGRSVFLSFGWIVE